MKTNKKTFYNIKLLLIVCVFAAEFLGQSYISSIILMAMFLIDIGWELCVAVINFTEKRKTTFHNASWIIIDAIGIVLMGFVLYNTYPF